MAAPLTKAVAHVVSDDDELLILVDSDDREIGSMTKAAAHDGRGALHRAFSVFVFNPAGELLLQQCASKKRLWPGYWSNSCCSHPRHGETTGTAVRRRVREELGMTLVTTFLFKFEYRACFDTRGTEHELCWVYAGRTADGPRVNSHEVVAWRYVNVRQLQAEIDQAPDAFTPWFKIAWPRVRATMPAL